MEYIKKVLNNFEDFMGEAITENDVISFFEKTDIVIKTIMEGFLGIYEAYSESEEGTIIFVLEHSCFLVQANIKEEGEAF